jgi:hypothetical protein
MCYIGSKVMWLDNLIIYAANRKEADKIAFKKLKIKYPEYGDFIQLF